MLKRIMIIVITVIVFVGGFYYIHQSLQSKVETTLTNFAITNKIETVPYADSQSFVQQKTGKYLLLFTGSDSNSKYLEESILPVVNENIDIPIIHVDMDAASDFGSTRFKSSWNFEVYPALVYVSVENKAITNHAVIQSSESNPITIQNLKTWLNKNNIWRGTFQ